MQDKIVLLIMSLFFSISIIFAINDGHHFRLYVTADVKGETEPCG